MTNFHTHRSFLSSVPLDGFPKAAHHSRAECIQFGIRMQRNWILKFLTFFASSKCWN